MDGFTKWDSGHARYKDGEGSAGFGNKLFGAKVHQDRNSVGFETNSLGYQSKGSLGYAFGQDHKPGENYKGEIGVGASASSTLGLGSLGLPGMLSCQYNHIAMSLL